MSASPATITRVRVDDLTAQAVKSVRSLRSVDELIADAPAIIAAMGFDRIIVSEVADDVWTPLEVHVVNDGAWATDILTVGRENPQRLKPSLVEAEMRRTRVPIIVDEVQDHPGVNRPIALASKSMAYMAVPVVVGDDVGAFIHVDRYWHQASFSSAEGSQLAIFADAFGLALERAHLSERLATLAGELTSLTSGPSPFGIVPRQPVQSRRAPRCGVDLTPREQEVAELVADGLTNVQVARELVLSEATVKSHVKHILRKLGATHRAEAVSKLLRAGLA